MATIAVHDVSYRVGGRDLVAGVSFEVRPGEMLALVGPNGAGKSTLLGLCAGDLPPSGGSVHIDDTPIGDLRAGQLARVRAVMPQQASIDFPFSSREVVAMGRYPWPEEEPLRERQRVDGALARTDTGHLADRAVPTLSGGELARVVLARTLAQDAEVVLLDEPTASLDLAHQEACMTLGRALAREGRAVVAVVHDLNQAAAYADRIAMLHHGRLVAIGEPWRVLTPARIGRVFGLPVHVMRNPCRDCPLVVAAMEVRASPAGSA